LIDSIKTDERDRFKSFVRDWTLHRYPLKLITHQRTMSQAMFHAADVRVRAEEEDIAAVPDHPGHTGGPAVGTAEARQALSTCVPAKPGSPPGRRLAHDLAISSSLPKLK
jgi:hypothetical protein